MCVYVYVHATFTACSLKFYQHNHTTPLCAGNTCQTVYLHTSTHKCQTISISMLGV